jgi:hypothetical protein
MDLFMDTIRIAAMVDIHIQENVQKSKM